MVYDFVSVFGTDALIPKVMEVKLKNAFIMGIKGQAKSSTGTTITIALFDMHALVEDVVFRFEKSKLHHLTHLHLSIALSLSILWELEFDNSIWVKDFGIGACRFTYWRPWNLLFVETRCIPRRYGTNVYHDEI